MSEDIAFSAVLWFYAQRLTNVHGVYYYYHYHAKQSVIVTNSTLDKYKRSVDEMAKALSVMENVLRSSETMDK